MNEIKEFTGLFPKVETQFRFLHTLLPPGHLRASMSMRKLLSHVQLSVTS